MSHPSSTCILAYTCFTWGCGLGHDNWARLEATGHFVTSARAHSRHSTSETRSKPAETMRWGNQPSTFGGEIHTYPMHKPMYTPGATAGTGEVHRTRQKNRKAPQKPNAPYWVSSRRGCATSTVRTNIDESYTRTLGGSKGYGSTNQGDGAACGASLLKQSAGNSCNAEAGSESLAAQWAICSVRHKCGGKEQTYTAEAGNSEGNHSPFPLLSVPHNARAHWNSDMLTHMLHN